MLKKVLSTDSQTSKNGELDEKSKNSLLIKHNQKYHQIFKTTQFNVLINKVHRQHVTKLTPSVFKQKYPET